MDVKTNLITLLETFGFQVRLQGSFEENEEYPDSFFTFWNNDSTDWNHYNNSETGYIWSFDVNFYSTSPTFVNTKLEEARELLKQNGYVINGKGHDVASDQPSHTGRGITVIFIEHGGNS